MTSQEHYPNDYIQSLIRPSTLNSSLQRETAEDVQNCQHTEALLCLATTLRGQKGDLYSLVPKEHIALPFFNSVLKICSIRN